MQPAPTPLLPDMSSARWFGQPLPEACVEGVEHNLALLAEHVARVRASLAEIG